jgi:AraC family transcriptional activator of mtrCDE
LLFICRTPLQRFVSSRISNSFILQQHPTTEPTSLLSKFIDSIEAKLIRAECHEVIKPLYFQGVFEHADIFLQFHKGKYFSGKDNSPFLPGSFYFIPCGQNVNGKIGTDSDANPATLEALRNESLRNEFIRSVSVTDSWDAKENVISYVSFETSLYNAFPFFPLLDLPPFIIPPEEKLANILREICIEKEQNRLGKEIILKNYLHEFLVHLFRFIDSKPELKKPIEKLQFLTDVRLIDIVKYIQDNLEKDLTNAAIAKVAYVSEDYVGQFFKALTKRTLQDYIEHQRLDRAMHLLKTVPNSVQEVAAMVGFKDAAYFSRRFRMRFHVNANVVRQGRSQET